MSEVTAPKNSKQTLPLPNTCNLSRNLTSPRVQKVVRLNGLKFLIVIYHLVKFSGHRPCGSSDTAAKIQYVARQRHQRIWRLY